MTRTHTVPTRSSQAADTAPNPRSDSVWPRVDIYEADDAFMMVADLPGVEPDNIDVQLDGDTLTLSALRAEPAAGTTLHRELVHRDFQRRFKVNAEIDAESITAAFKDGVLRLHLPKAPEVKPRRIVVTPEA